MNYESLANILIIENEIKIAIRKVNYFTLHLSRCKDDKTRSKLFFISLQNIVYLSKLIIELNKQTVELKNSLFNKT